MMSDATQAPETVGKGGSDDKGATAEARAHLASIPAEDRKAHAEHLALRAKEHEKVIVRQQVAGRFVAMPLASRRIRPLEPQLSPDPVIALALVTNDPEAFIDFPGEPRSTLYVRHGALVGVASEHTLTGSRAAVDVDWQVEGDPKRMSSRFPPGANGLCSFPQDGKRQSFVRATRLLKKIDIVATTARFNHFPMPSHWLTDEHVLPDESDVLCSNLDKPPTRVDVSDALHVVVKVVLNDGSHRPPLSSAQLQLVRAGDP